MDLTQEKSDNGGDSSVTHISETQMVVDSDDTLSYNSDSSSKSEKSGISTFIYDLNFIN